jgi:hypothetical protein
MGAHRPEIQALRALAVALVVTYHLWPSALPGGFIGVDVFFRHLRVPHHRAAAARDRQHGDSLAQPVLGPPRSSNPASRALHIAVLPRGDGPARADQPLAAVAQRVARERRVRAELASGFAGRRLLRGRATHRVAGAALLVARFGGAVLPRVAGAAVPGRAATTGAAGRDRGRDDGEPRLFVV